MCVCVWSPYSPTVSLYSLSEFSVSHPAAFLGSRTKPHLSLAAAEHSQHSNRIWPEAATRRMVGKDWKEQVESFDKCVLPVCMCAATGGGGGITLIEP